MLIVLPTAFSVDLGENIKRPARNFALNAHCIEPLDHIIAPSYQLLDHCGYMCLRSPKRLYCCYLDRQVSCYPHSCKLGYILTQSFKLLRATVQTDIATAPASHQIGL